MGEITNKYMISSKSNLFSKVRHYVKLSQELQGHLTKYPDKWTEYQDEFISTLDEIYRDIIEFEKNNIDKIENKVKRIKERFIKRYRQHFLYGEFIRWSFEKPFGYVGDFKIIDEIYKNQPSTKGFDRLWDNYFQQLDICKAIRERKEETKKHIIDFINRRQEENIRIMDLAFGPGRLVKEILSEGSNNKVSKIIFDCYDIDEKAVNYAKKILYNFKDINFFLKNVVRLSLKNDITKEIPYKYDLIYSTGLFDYLSEKLATRLIMNLKKLLKKDGLMIICNVRDRYSNPSVAWMEWVADWNLIYRTEDGFKNIFLKAGFPLSNVQIISQNSKVMQYCFASQTK